MGVGCGIPWGHAEEVEVEGLGCKKKKKKTDMAPMNSSRQHHAMSPLAVFQFISAMVLWGWSPKMPEKNSSASRMCTGTNTYAV